MNTDEVAQFEAEPYHQDAVKVRYWDDAGKQDSLTVPDLNHYIPMMQKLLIQPAA
jgi:predicted HD phosphohydrolase